MGPVYLFSLAAQQAEWLSTRQSVVARNIANADTPGFKAQDLVPFSAVLEHTPVRLAATSAGHFSASPAQSSGTIEMRPEQVWETSHSGNTVSLEKELLKAGETGRDLSLNTAVVKSFHRMFMASLRDRT